MSAPKPKHEPKREPKPKSEPKPKPKPAPKKGSGDAKFDKIFGGGKGKSTGGKGGAPRTSILLESGSSDESDN